ncbi:MAG TPA: hypothetical protein VFQ86_08120, partial [Arachidicoccus soli]|nr:hypothetical protein [Arachidicoccus soli]
ALTNVSNNGALPIKDEIVIPMNAKIVKDLPKTRYIIVRAIFNSTAFNNNIIYANAALKIWLNSYLTLKASL